MGANTANSGARGRVKGPVLWTGIALMAALALVAAECARLGISGLIVELAQTETDKLAASPRARPAAELDRVAGFFSDSLAYAPRNPWALEGLAALDLARVRLAKDPPKALAFARDAHTRLREAIRQRPTSPFLWANLALAKLYLDQVDSEFFLALRQADDLGPWEPATQQGVLFAGLAAWDKLSEDQRQSMQRVVQRGGVRNARKLFEIVKSYRRFDLVCPLGGYDAVAGADCRKAAAAAQSAKRPGGDKR